MVPCLQGDRSPRQVSAPSTVSPRATQAHRAPPCIVSTAASAQVRAPASDTAASLSVSLGAVAELCDPVAGRTCRSVVIASPALEELMPVRRPRSGSRYVASGPGHRRAGQQAPTGAGRGLYRNANVVTDLLTGLRER